MIKRTREKVHLPALLIGSTLINLKSVLREFNAVRLLQCSDLKDIILNPTLINYRAIDVNHHQLIVKVCNAIVIYIKKLLIVF